MSSLYVPILFLDTLVRLLKQTTDYSIRLSMAMHLTISTNTSGLDILLSFMRGTNLILFTHAPPHVS